MGHKGGVSAIGTPGQASVPLVILGPEARRSDIIVYKGPVGHHDNLQTLGGWGGELDRVRPTAVVPRPSEPGTERLPFAVETTGPVSSLMVSD